MHDFPLASSYLKLAIYENKEVSILAHQLLAFTSTGHQYSTFLSSVTRQVVADIVERTSHSPPSLVQPTRKGRTRSIEDEDPRIWPAEWAVDKSLFKRVVKRFETATQDLTSSLGEAKTQLNESSNSVEISAQKNSPSQAPSFKALDLKPANSSAVDEHANSASISLRGSPISCGQPTMGSKAHNQANDLNDDVIGDSLLNRDASRRIPRHRASSVPPEDSNDHSKVTDLFSGLPRHRRRRVPAFASDHDSPQVGTSEQADDPPTVQDSRSHPTSIMQNSFTAQDSRSQPAPPIQNSSTLAHQAPGHQQSHQAPVTQPHQAPGNQHTFGRPASFGNNAYGSSTVHPPPAHPFAPGGGTFGQAAFGQRAPEARQDGGAFTPQMIAQLRDIMRQEIQQSGRAGEDTQRSRRPHDRGDDHEHTTASFNRFRASDLGFFHPDAPESYGAGGIIFAHKETIYREVFTFVQRVNDYAHIVGESAVKESLSFCFRGSAMTWYLKEIEEFKRKAFRSLPLIDFTDELEARFKMRISKALNKLTSETFTAKDAREDREATGFLQNVILYSQSVGISDLQGQLTWAWNQLDLELRSMVIMPTAHTSIQDFTEELDAKKELWKTMMSTRRQPFQDRTQRVEKRGEDQRAGNQQLQTRQPFVPYQSRLPYPQRPFSTYQPYTGFPARPPLQEAVNFNNQYRPAIPLPTPSNPAGYAAKGPPPPKRLAITAANAEAQQDNENRNPFFRDTSDRRGDVRGQQNRGGYRPQGYQPSYQPPPYQQMQYQRPYQPLAVPAYHAEPSAYEDPYYAQYQDVPTYFSEAPHTECYYSEDARQEEPSEAQQREDSPVTVDAFHADLELNPLPSRHFTCRDCQDSFQSSNKLFQHIEKSHDSECRTRQEPATAFHADETVLHSDQIIDGPELIESDAGAVADTGLAFRSYHYATVLLGFAWQGSSYTVCVDTGCTMTLFDRKFLNDLALGLTIKKARALISVRGVGTARHLTDDYLLMDLYIKGSVDGRESIAHIRREVHIVDNLKAKLLLGMDIMTPERMIVNLDTKQLTLNSCRGLTTNLGVTARDNTRIRRVIKPEGRIVVDANTIIRVPVRTDQPLPDRDFLFEPYLVGAYAHIVDCSLSAIYVRNESSSPITIRKSTSLGRLVEFQEQGCYQISPEEHRWAAKGEIKVDMPSNGYHSVLPNGAHAYGSPDEMAKLSALVDEFAILWKDTGRTIKLPEEKWMSVPLSSDWNSTTAPRIVQKVYPLGERDKIVVDEEFNKLHQQGKMQWATEPTPFGFPVFVVWRTINGPDGQPARKHRVVTDIRGLNKLTTTDAHPIPAQSDIMAQLRGCGNISLMDGLAFFLQFVVAESDRHKFSFITHRGKEQLNVAAMGFKNSPAYVQRIMDEQLRLLREFCRVYIDDIVTFSKSFASHLGHLRALFVKLVELQVTLSPNKTFLNYPSITLLGQKVDAFGLSTTEERIAAIKAIRFPRDLRALETYLGLANYQRDKVAWYAQRAESLQQEKTRLLKGSPAQSGQKRKAYSRSTLIEQSPGLSNSFYQLQRALTAPNFLVHFDANRRLFLGLDASKERGFGVEVYHVKGNPVGDDFRKSDIQHVLFLSKTLSTAESHYWPTELEVACLVWTIRKTRHLVEACKHPAVIYTDHSATLGIAKQTTLSSSATDKLNLRLIRASQYLSQFDLDVRHKAGRLHTVPDALSRLPALAGEERASDIGELDRVDAFKAGAEIQIINQLAEQATKEKSNSANQDTADGEVSFHSSLVQMSEVFKRRLLNAYAESTKWTEILTTVRRSPMPSGIQFSEEDGLLYFTDFANRKRLCLPKEFEKEIFTQAHDKNHHAGFTRSYEAVSTNFYFRKLSSRLQRYITHCRECSLCQTKRHQPYGALNPIVSPPVPFHTVSFDFILALPTKQGMDVALTATCEFSKKVMIMAGKNTHTAEDWASVMVDGLADWGIPKAFVHDRDRKFLSEFWRAVFKKLDVDFLASTAYHPQTDGQSERTNQTVELALRYALANNPELDWVAFLPTLRARLNNLPSSSTGLSPNEVVMGFKTRDPLALLKPDEQKEDWLEKRSVNATEAEAAIAWANVTAKNLYDRHHRPLTLQVGEQAFLRLHKGYTLPSVKSPKLAIQRVGPFTILERKGNLAYKLDLPVNWKIHPVISIANLEPAPKGNDPYGRPRPDHPEPVTEFNDDWHAYEVESLLGHRLRRYGRGKPISEYLVRWKGYGPEFDRWYGEDLLDEAGDLVKDYKSKHGVPLDDTIRRPDPTAEPVRIERSIGGVTHPAPPHSPIRRTEDVPRRGRGRPRKT